MTATGRVLVRHTLCADPDTGQFALDLPRLKPALRGAAALLLCSPHNPSGRVWRRAELAALAAACADAGVLLVSDEIWADWTLPHEASGRRSWSAQACRASPVAAPDGPVRMAARAQSTRASLIAGRLGSSGATRWPVELGSRPR